jgi:hypothetical protein
MKTGSWAYQEGRQPVGERETGSWEDRKAANLFELERLTGIWADKIAGNLLEI